MIVRDFVIFVVVLVCSCIGFTQPSPAQLKIIQEVITLGVFVPFALLYLRQPVGWNFVWAGCGLPGAVYFMFT